MKFKELLRREALAACAVATVSLSALAQTDAPAAPSASAAPMDQHHGARRLMREMAKTDGDPTGEAAVPHRRDTALAVVKAPDAAADREQTEADRFKEPKTGLDMKLYQFKDD